MRTEQIRNTKVNMREMETRILKSSIMPRKCGLREVRRANSHVPKLVDAESVENGTLTYAVLDEDRNSETRSESSSELFFHHKD